MSWIYDKLPPEKDSIFAKFKGTSKYKNYMWLKNSDEVLVTIEHEGERFVDTGRTCDGEWHNDYLKLYSDAKIVAWMPFPEAYKE